jgi:hypothetical protein
VSREESYRKYILQIGISSNKLSIVTETQPLILAADQRAINYFQALTRRGLTLPQDLLGELYRFDLIKFVAGTHHIDKRQQLNPRIECDIYEKTELLKVSGIDHPGRFNIGAMRLAVHYNQPFVSAVRGGESFYQLPYIKFFNDHKPFDPNENPTLLPDDTSRNQNRHLWEELKRGGKLVSSKFGHLRADTSCTEDLGRKDILECGVLEARLLIFRETDYNDICQTLKTTDYAKLGSRLAG